MTNRYYPNGAPLNYLCDGMFYPAMCLRDLQNGAVDKPLFSRVIHLILSLITVIFQYQSNKKGLLT